MNSSFTIFDHEPGAFALSWLVASYAWLGILLIRDRVREAEPPVRQVWLVCGSLFLGFGIWAFHFVGMLGWRPGLDLAFSVPLTALSLLLAVLGAWPLTLGMCNQPNGLARWKVKLGFALGLASMHYVGVYAAETVPGPRWVLAWIVLSGGLAITLAVAAMSAPVWCDSASVSATRWRHRLLAACGLGTLLAAVHHAGVYGASYAPGTTCSTAGLLSGPQLAGLVLLAAVLGLSLIVWLSIDDARIQTQAHRVAQTLRERADALEHRIFNDAVTGLPTRAALDAEIAQLPQQNRAGVVLIHLELDGYQTVCDSWGQQMANELIREAGARIRGQLPGEAQLVHAGHEQFLVLLLQPPQAPELEQRVHHLACVLRRPFQLGAMTVSLAHHLGVAVAAAPGDLERLMSMARAASDYARRSGSAWCRFEPHMLGDAQEALELQGALRNALERGELTLVFQPKVDAVTRECVGFEALLRWRHPELGWVSPAAFIPVAERFGLMPEIGQWVLEESLRTLARWQQAGLYTRLAINLSTQQLEQSDFVASLQAGLARHSIQPSLVCLEITESVAMLRPGATRERLERLRALGVELAIDDFGTGYSSLSYLHTLPVNELKIDRSFVLALEKGSLPIIQATVKMARAFNMRVVAEGVETEAQRNHLVACGCDLLQGYLFARPMPPEQVLATYGSSNSSRKLSTDAASLVLRMQP